eukprot:CAMPEP_0198314006 /NCGR_PEP_ID=MMETSP1450-20131203/4842_1 /TAXON_ID=753684 ORGANISM="Madagascaria erythrocladiodes, Strain CCMP3234" /NCGR_SAMPLE_ID=MMETSP1450 /ASSEMBLY_ACC=CAM_ASM_001115 /LENGTH=139 /DNA_ID=CAMNT_0044017043 /DNA_START=156 /DNA_END=575 /DNA_ORIENTATION=+
MISKITHVNVPVENQKEATEWFTEKLGFKVATDVAMSENDPKTRWVTLNPPNQTDLEVVLQPPEWGPDDTDPEVRKTRIGNWGGFVFHSDDVEDDFKTLKAKGVEVMGEPKDLPWGKSLVFKDLYGHVHNIVQPPAKKD